MADLQGRAAQAPRGRTPSTGPATSSPTGSSTTPRPTPPSTCRTSWSTRRSRSCTTSCARALARQGITEEAYLKVTGKTDEEIHAEFRPQAEKRVKTLLVLSEIAKVKGVEVPDADVEAEVDRARARYASDRSLVRYFESRARPKLHPEHAPTVADRRAARRRVARRPPRGARDCRTSRTPDEARRWPSRRPAEAAASIGVDRSGSVTPPAAGRSAGA